MTRRPETGGGLFVASPYLLMGPPTPRVRRGLSGPRLSSIPAPTRHARGKICSTSPRSNVTRFLRDACSAARIPDPRHAGNPPADGSAPGPAPGRALRELEREDLGEIPVPRRSGARDKLALKGERTECQRTQVNWPACERRNSRSALPLTVLSTLVLSPA